ncbi:IscS subfamily cysteine desulfurase [Halalkalibacter akibai]|uniref:Cysteine desulfurase n=1 Tax=Halalkalibacter akibai (strain ATCC 43226 / DSM 21942 / CIP 109018 / JCM 9157 / 1139) TaxID=1236973 RepID=W4QU27_HALA3|nr:IscS subfamily cysteine desulfurase [Halalkalibacter akibai]GAE35113.1 cysteine desulfurase [Halalkalibacter akibai JCM 9157]
MIYFDYSATTPMSSYALETYNRVATDFFANSRSIHRQGLESDDVLTLSRQSIADLLSVQRDEIYFTGSGSEATFLALTSLAFSREHKGRTIITTEGEHHSVHQTMMYLQEHGFNIIYLPVNQFGQVTEETLRSTITADTILVSIAHANSEIGTVQNLSELGHILNEEGILFHSDCVQTFGKLDIPTSLLTSATFSAHKLYGPKGVGAAYINKQTHWTPFLQGTTHEMGFRAGTVDVPSIAAFAAAAEEYWPIAKDDMVKFRQYRQMVVDSFSSDSRFIFEGHPTKRLPFHICLRIKGVEGQLVMLDCNRNGLAVSTGSACRVGDTKPSNTMLSIGRSIEEAHELVRITFGRYTKKADINKLIDTLKQIVITYKGD